MDESKRPYMIISVSKRDYPAVSDMLEVFVKWDVFKRENCEVDYNSEKEEYNFDIKDVFWKTAAFIGDMLEAELGRDVQWFHYQRDDDEEDG